MLLEYRECDFIVKKNLKFETRVSITTNNPVNIEIKKKIYKILIS